MRILLTNDDGIAAPGLACLERIAAELSDDVWIVAPEVEHSGASRALSLRQPLRVRSLDARRHAVTGTPTDCVMMAMAELMRDARPDLILSGVNQGQNLAEDVTRSGTVGAAIQGMELGVPSIALSQTVRLLSGAPEPMWETAEAFGPGLIRALLTEGWPANVVININFPDLPPALVKEVAVTRQGFRYSAAMGAEKRIDPSGRPYFWLTLKGREPDPPEDVDLAAIYAGKISVTPLHIDLTHRETVAALKGRFGGAPPRSGT